VALLLRRRRRLAPTAGRPTAVGGILGNPPRPLARRSEELSVGKHGLRVPDRGPQEIGHVGRACPGPGSGRYCAGAAA